MSNSHELHKIGIIVILGFAFSVTMVIGGLVAIVSDIIAHPVETLVVVSLVAAFIIITSRLQSPRR